MTLKRFVIYIIIFASIAVIGAISMKAEAVTYYIAGDTGNDTTGDGSSGSPWKTIQKAADTTVAGDTVNVKGGDGITYASTSGGTACNTGGFEKAVVCETTDGTSGSPITYQAWTGTGIPFIDAGTPSIDTSMGIGVSGGDYIIINGFEIVNAGVNSTNNSGGIRVSSSIGSVLKNNIIHDNVIGSSGIFMGSGSAGKIYNNTIDDSGYGIRVFINTNTEVKNNIVTNSKSGVGIRCDVATTPIFSNNLVWNNTTNYSGCTPSTNDINSDPLLTNLAGGDFTQTGTSPTINTGTNTSVTTDVAGNTRPGGGVYDIGAYEYKQFYVAGDTGNDSNTGTSASPWATVGKAADVLRPGDTVNIKGGLTYTLADKNMAFAGTATEYIIYQAWFGTGIPKLTTSGADVFNTVLAYTKIDSLYFFNANKCIDGTLGNTILTNNVFTDCSLSFISIFGAGTKIYNNTFADSLITFGGVITTSSVDIRNNIFANNTGTVILSFGGTHTIDYNLFYNTGTNCSGCVLGTGNITGQDPLFVNAAGGDYSLQRGSPARNTGTTLAEVTDDIIEVTRPQGSAYDIGAYEWYGYDVVVSLTALSPDPTNDTTPTLSGTVTTSNIATMSSVEYSIDGGAWTSTGVTASDGTFNEVSEAFTITVSPSLTDGSHTIRVRGTDSLSAVTDSSIYGTDTFTIDTTGPGEVVITDIGLIDDVPNLDSLYYYFTSQTPVIQGTCEANGIVYFLNTTASETYSIGCSATGTFSITIDNPELERTLSEFDYYQKDSVGNSGSTRYLALVVGVENFPEWLLIQLGLSPDTVTPDTEVNEEDLDEQNDNQDEVEDSMDDDFDLPGTGDDDDDEDKDTRTEEEKDADRQKELVKDLLLCGVPIVVLLVLLGAGFYFLGKPKEEKDPKENTTG